VTKCMGWHGKACELCANLAKNAQDEDHIGIVKTDVLKSPCPMYEEIKEDKE